MKFSAVVFAGIVAVAYADSSSNSTSSYTPAQQSCLDKCSASDVTCRASCLGNPAPTADMANATTKCSAACPQGSGTPAETKAYGECLRECAVNHYLPGGTGNTGTTGSTSSTTSTTGSGNSTSPSTGTGTGSNTNSASPSGSSTSYPSSSNSTTSATGSSGSGSGNSTSSSSGTSTSSGDKSTTSHSSSPKPSSGAGQLVASGAAFVALIATFFVL